MFKKFNLASIISIIIIGLFVGVVFVYADWSAPISSPPTCVSGDPGCDAPINIGSVDQTKNAGLGLVGNFNVGGFSIFNNNVGIKTSPNYELDVNGQANATELCIAGVCQPNWPSGGSVAWTGITNRPGSCSAGSSIRVINADGTVTCESDDLGGGIGGGGAGIVNQFAIWTSQTSLGGGSP